MIIGLTGTYCAGKDAAADYLRGKGFIYHSCSDIIRDECKKRGIETTRDNLINMGNDLRAKNGNGILAELTLKKISENNEKNSLVVSIRHPAEVEALRKDPNFFLIAIDAPIELRFQRSQSREGRPEDRDTFEEFAANEKREKEGTGAGQQLNAVAEIADYIITNESSLEELYRKIDEVLEHVKI